jgi:hypothetical protein
MTIIRPFRRTCRQFVGGSYLPHGNHGFIADSRFAKAPGQYIRAFLLIQKDLQEVFHYVEPADENEECYSYRIHELLMRSCVEVEANCKAILSENGYIRPGDADTRDANGYSQPGKKWNRNDYEKLNATHRLSSFQVKFPVWHGNHAVRTPFASWGPSGRMLTWYDAYNATKHDRHKQFKEANFGNLLDAVAGLVALLSSQFGDYEFEGPYVTYFVDDTYKSDGFETAVGKYLRIKYPDDWPDNERYDFEWEKIASDPDPFQSLQF